LKFRYSYGENVLQHSVEVGLVAGILATQIGANPQTAKTAGFLHDIGKALTHEVDGPHAEIGADLAKRYGQKEIVITAIREHHDREMTTVESFLVAAADAISAARPGARQDTIENYIQRLEALEEVAQGFEGVERVYAIQAGREVRVLVNPENTDDVSAATLARNIVEKIEETLAYPGQIRVVVIRESRTVEIAQ
jgi:ribonuclease Y